MDSSPSSAFILKNETNDQIHKQINLNSENIIYYSEIIYSQNNYFAMKMQQIAKNSPQNFIEFIFDLEI